MREMKDSGIEWIGQIPKEWELVQTKRRFRNIKRVVGDAVDEYERLALTMHGVLKRSKEDSEGLQPEKFEGYQILKINELVFKLIDLENVKTSRVGISPYTGLVSPAYIVLTNSYEDNRFFYYWFMFMYYNEIFNHLGGDGVRSSLNAKDLLSLPIPNINVNLQKRIADYLDNKCKKIDDLIEKQQKTIEKLKEYKLSIITEAVTKGLSPNADLKDSGTRFIGYIPINWTVSKLKYMSLAIGDGIHGTPEYDSDGEIYFVNGNNIGAEKLVFKTDTNTINETEFKKYKKPLLNDNTILMTLNGATYGKTSFYNGEEILLGKSAGYITLKPNENKEFVRYYLQSAVAKLIMDYSLCGSTIANVSLRTLNDFAIPYPPKVEQVNIVKYLDKHTSQIDRSISYRQNIIERLLEYKKSFIYEVVTGKKEV